MGAAPWRAFYAERCPCDGGHAHHYRVPEELTFQPKPELALVLLQDAVRRGSLPFRWVAVDALYGDTPAFLDGVAALEKW